MKLCAEDEVLEASAEKANASRGALPSKTHRFLGNRLYPPRH